jgi:NAD(P)H-dependent nitrite reductase small subunit
MSQWVRAIAQEDLAPGTCTEVKVGETVLAIYNVGGTFYATTNRCAHRGGPLGQGFLDGTTIMCPWHAWVFDVTTGENTANGTLKVQTYPVLVEDGEVKVQLHDV